MSDSLTTLENLGCSRSPREKMTQNCWIATAALEAVRFSLSEMEQDYWFHLCFLLRAGSLKKWRRQVWAGARSRSPRQQLDSVIERLVVVTVQTRNRYGLCGLFGRPDAVENCNEDAAATCETKVDQSKAKAGKGERGNVKAISTHIELMMWGDPREKG